MTGSTGVIQEAAAGRDVTVSLTPEGEQIWARLGDAWFAALIRAAHLAHPLRRVDLLLIPARGEPMSPPTEVLPGVPGNSFTQLGALGVISLSGDEQQPSVGRRAQVPDVALFDGESSFAFVDGRHGLRRRIGQLYGEVYRRAPLALDLFKQVRNARRPWLKGTHARGAQALHPYLATHRPSPHQGRTGAWFALHWLESGGAESWAFESAQVAADLGYEVVITVDRCAPQRQLERALAITPHVYLAGNVLPWQDWSEFGVRLVEEHNIRLLHIHHSASAYQLLPLLRHTAPHLVVWDSTHLPEHRTGGFVRQSLEHSNLIDQHHVISPGLRDVYLLDAQIPAERVAYRPLIGLDGQDPGAQTGTPRQPGEPLRVGFLGRLAPQKRPFLFVDLVRRLHQADPSAFRFIMQGSGPLDDFVAQNIARARLQSVIERRDWGPVDAFLADVDVLVVCSDNEGLTLTALEAAQHGVLVLSADVGSQVTVVAPDLVMPASPVAFLRQSSAVLQRLAHDQGLVDRLLDEQRHLHDDLRAHEPATTFIRRRYAEILKETA